MALVPANAPRLPQSDYQGNLAVTAAAIRGLYQACHLPPPAIFYARDPIDFGRTVRRLHRVWRPWIFAPLMSGALVLEAALGLTWAPETGLAGGLTAILVVPGLLATGAWPRQGTTPTWSIRLGLTMAATALAAGTVTVTVVSGHGWLSSAGWGGAAASVVGALLLIFDLLRPSLARWRLRRASSPRSSVTSIVLGTVPANPVIVPRLLRALDDIQRDESRGPRLVDTTWGNDTAREQARTAVRDEIGRGTAFPRAEPILGRCVERWDGLASRMSGDIPKSSLPLILQSAVTLMEWTEAVSTFHGAAVVLPAGALESVSPREAPGGWRRLRRDPWWRALQCLDEVDPGLELAIDLAPHPHIADILLARRVAREPDARSRGMAIAAMGISRFMEALRPEPVQEDASGRLFQIGRSEDPSTFVEVRDRVFGPDGRPLRHWLSVPPHVATAHEAIAWTFGMSAAEYRPTRET